MITELTENYIPDKIFFRDDQINRIKKTFEDFKKYGTAQNLIIQGYTGTGKTAGTSKVLKEVGNGSYLFSIASVNQTCHQLLKSLFNFNYSAMGKTLTEIILKLKKEPKILVFEEINRLKDKAEIKSLFDNLNTIYRETECPCIIITNLFDINQLMNDDARLTLNFGIVEFSTYSEKELYEIFLDRIETIKQVHGIIIDKWNLKNICSIVWEKGESSARQVRTILKSCLMENNWKEGFISKIIEGTLDEHVFLKIKNMSERDKKFLSVLYELYSKKQKIGGYMAISYEEISSIMGLSISRISYFVDIFENDYALITTRHENKGKGNKRIILFNYPFFKKLQENQIIKSAEQQLTIP